MSLFSFQDIITSITGIMILVVMMLVLEVINRDSAKPPAPRVQSSEIPDLEQQIAPLEAERETLSTSIERQEAVIAGLLPDNAQQLNRDIQWEEDKALNLNQKISELAAKLAKAKQQMGSTLTDTPEDAQELQQLKEQLARIQAENRVTFEFTASHKTPVLVQCSRTGVQVMVMGGKPTTHTFLSAPGSTPKGAVAKFEKWVEGLDKDMNAFVVLVKPSAAPYATEVINLLRVKQFDVGYEPLEESKTALFSDRQGP